MEIDSQEGMVQDTYAAVGPRLQVGFILLNWPILDCKQTLAYQPTLKRKGIKVKWKKILR